MNSKKQNHNVFWKAIVVVLVILLGVSYYIDAEKTRKIATLEAQEEPICDVVEPTCETAEYEEKIAKLTLENKEMRQANNEYASKNADLEVEKAALQNELLTVNNSLSTTKNELLTVTNTLATTKSELATTKSELATTKNSLTTANNDLAAALASHTFVYVDENDNIIYSEKVQTGEDIKNAPAVPAKAGFHSEWAVVGTNSNGYTVIKARYYHELSFNFSINNYEGVEVGFDKTDIIKIYGNKDLIIQVDDDGSSSITIDGQSILKAVITNDGGHLDIVVAGWYFNGDNGDKYTNDDTYIMTSDVVATAYVDQPACILAGSKITMADGSEKNVEDIQAGDYVLSYDYRVGTIQSKKVLGVLTGNSLVDVLIIKLNNGSELKIADVEYLFDMDARKFIAASMDTKDGLAGKNVMINNNGAIATAQIISVETYRDRVDHYTMYVADSNNYVANGIIAHIPIGVINSYAIDENYKYDEAQYLADVAQYGVYTYDQFADVISEEIFDAFHVKDAKFAVEKGLVSFEFVHDGMGVIQRSIDQANQ